MKNSQISNEDLNICAESVYDPLIQEDTAFPIDLGSIQKANDFSTFWLAFGVTLFLHEKATVPPYASLRYSS